VSTVALVRHPDRRRAEELAADVRTWLVERGHTAID
jgi:hypothetical protein